MADIVIGNGTDLFVFDNANNTILTDAGVIDETNTKTFIVTAVAKTATKAAYVTITGELINGAFTTQGNTAFGDSEHIFTLGSKATATVPKDAVLTIIKVGEDNSDSTKNTMNGLLKVEGTVNMKVTGVTESASYGTLNYQITYTDENYTVYTMLSTGVSNASAGDSFTVSDNLTIRESMEIPAGVTIVVAEGKKISVLANKYISIGTPITTLGAVSSIEGTIELGNDAFVVVYADDSVDMSKAKIVDSRNNKVKNSQFSVINEVYATVYINVVTTSTSWTNVSSVLVPDIDGFRFLGWDALSYENPVGSMIGSTDYEANMKADKVQVIFQKVDGITYYVDNEKATSGQPMVKRTIS